MRHQRAPPGWRRPAESAGRLHPSRAARRSRHQVRPVARTTSTEPPLFLPHQHTSVLTQAHCRARRPARHTGQRRWSATTSPTPCPPPEQGTWCSWCREAAPTRRRRRRPVPTTRRARGPVVRAYEASRGIGDQRKVLTAPRPSQGHPRRPRAIAGQPGRRRGPGVTTPPRTPPSEHGRADHPARVTPTPSERSDPCHLHP